jgi:hypothetical protein
MKRWERATQALKLQEAEAELAANEPGSHRHVAEQLGIPRSTLQYWQQRQEALEATPAVVAFFESPAGLVLLHRWLIATQVVITLLGSGGSRLVCVWLELTGLNRFVAASYGAQQQVGAVIETATVHFGQQEKARLAKEMPSQQITTCQDETFHPEPCLVALEPVSNFILLEQYAPTRTAAAWQAAMAEALKELPVQVIQSTSDEAQAIRCHVEQTLGAHHSPDLFHLQQEVVKGTAGALAAKTRQAEQALTTATRERERQSQAAAAGANSGPHPSPKPDPRLRQAQWQVTAAEVALEEAHAQQAQAQQAIQAINRAYHPYHLETAQPQTTADIERQLEQAFAQLEQVADTASLSPRCRERLQKARRVVTDLLATVTFFIMTVTAKIEALDLAPEVESVVLNQLIPALYLRRVAAQTTDREQRQRLQHHATELLAPLHAPGSPLTGLPPDELALIEQVATESAHLFQRSSSCVEGRNGQLALHHHHLHRIRPRKLAALTTIHNYFIRRPDGTTPAERFFGSKPADLFEWLLDHVPMPARPARKRPPPPVAKPLLRAVA